MSVNLSDASLKDRFYKDDTHVTIGKYMTNARRKDTMYKIMDSERIKTFLESSPDLLKFLAHENAHPIHKPLLDFFGMVADMEDAHVEEFQNHTESLKATISQLQSDDAHHLSHIGNLESQLVAAIANYEASRNLEKEKSTEVMILSNDLAECEEVIQVLSNKLEGLKNELEMSKQHIASEIVLRQKADDARAALAATLKSSTCVIGAYIGEHLEKGKNTDIMRETEISKFLATKEDSKAPSKDENADHNRMRSAIASVNMTGSMTPNFDPALEYITEKDEKTAVAEATHSEQFTSSNEDMAKIDMLISTRTSTYARTESAPASDARFSSRESSSYTPTSFAYELVQSYFPQKTLARAPFPLPHTSRSSIPYRTQEIIRYQLWLMLLSVVILTFALTDVMLGITVIRLLTRRTEFFPAN